MPVKALNLRVPRLGRNRYGVYYVRYSVINPDGKRRVKQESLDTKDPGAAKASALRFCLMLAEFSCMSETKKTFLPPDYKIVSGPTLGVEANGPKDHERAMQALDKLLALEAVRAKSSENRAVPPTAQAAHIDVSGNGSTIPTKAKIRSKLSLACEAHLQEVQSLAQLDKTSTKPGSTITQRKIVYEDLMELFGDRFLDEVLPEDLVLKWKPAELNRKSRRAPYEQLGAGTIKKRQQYTSDFFNWAFKELRYPYAYPLDSAIVPNKLVKAKTNQYKEFTEDDLRQLFSPSYAKKMGQKPGWYWLPLLALYSGARRGELLNRRPSDFKIVEGVKVFHIPTGKSADSVRTIPVHSKLLELGLWDYVEYLKKNNHSSLFPGRSVEDEEKSIGDQWPKWVERCGVLESGKVFHSFRSTAITDMHNNSHDHEAMRKTTGHSGAGVKGTHGDYVRGATLKRLVQAVEALEHPVVQIEGLKLADPTFSKYVQKVTLPEYQANKERDREKRVNHQAAKTAREKAAKKGAARK